VPKVSQAKIIEITKATKFKKQLYGCFVWSPSKCSRRRIEYLREAIPKGFRKKLLIWNGQIAGQIEYSPAEVSYYPIIGDNVTVLNCIWVLRRAGGKNLGKMLLTDVLRSERNASGFATVALESHWSPWFRKDQMERLGFKSIESISVTQKTKSKPAFKIHLMWMPAQGNAKTPTWNRHKLLEGITACTAHPLYHPQTYKEKEIFLEKALVT
jgi:hypothetical protein